MLCEKCKQNNATTHIKTVINGVVTEKHLCGYCAAKEGYNKFASGGFAQILSSVLGEGPGLTGALTDKRCPTCKSGFSDIAENGRVGCPDCYKTFEEQLMPYIRRMHGNVRHVGNAPNKSVPAVVNTESELTKMRDKLNELIKSEKFEEAAVIRDEIKKMKEANDNE